MRTLAALLVVALAGCSAAPTERHLVVFAAASLRGAFTDLAAAFTDVDPGSAVELSTAGSATLLSQLTQGAAADVLATADTPTMDRAARAGLLAGPPVPFASNVLTIAVAPGNPKSIESIRDLDEASLVVCAVQVPSLPRLRDETGVRLDPVSEESSVTDVLNKVTSGQADAGLVYLTDARAAGDRVTAVPLPEAAGMPNIYRIAVLKDSDDAVLASRFVDFVTAPAGRRILTSAGFGDP